MERRTSWRIVVAAGLLASGCVVRYGESAGGAARIDSELTVSGREEFLRACAPCHGADARGGGPVAVALRTPPTDLTVLAARAGGRFPRERVLAVLTGDVSMPAHGSRDMPVWSERFAPTDVGATAAASIYARRWLDALASYLASIQQADANARCGDCSATAAIEPRWRRPSSASRQAAGAVRRQRVGEGALEIAAAVEIE